MVFNVFLKKLNDRDILEFKLNDDKDYFIDMNSENQEGLTKLFYRLIELSFDNEIEFNLDCSAHEDDLFKEISEEYLKKLTIELKNIKTNIPSELISQ